MEEDLYCNLLIGKEKLIPTVVYAWSSGGFPIHAVPCWNLCGWNGVTRGLHLIPLCLVFEAGSRSERPI